MTNTIVSPDETFLCFLKKEFKKRSQSNPAYSLRAFARDLEIDQSLLSKFLNGKIELSWKMVIQCLEKISPPEDVIKHFKDREFIFTHQYQVVEDGVLESLASWKFWAILEFFKIESSPSFQRLADKFDISAEEAESIVGNLIDQGFIEKNENTYKILKPNNNWAASSKASKLRRDLQKGLNYKSIEAIDNIPIEKRHHCSLTLSVRKDKLPEFKEKLATLMEEIGHDFQKNDQADSVYQLTLGFFPLTNEEE